MNDKGTMSGKELEEALLVQDTLPPYLIDFLDRYECTYYCKYDYPILCPCIFLISAVRPFHL